MENLPIIEESKSPEFKESKVSNKQPAVFESGKEKSIEINNIKKEIDRYFSSVQKVAQIAAVSFVGLLSHTANGQDIPSNRMDGNIKIENNEQLKNQIFNEVDIALKNGVLKNKSDNAYYFEFKNNNYDISYNLDTNGDGEKDLNPQISVSCVDGNFNYDLVKGQNEISNLDKDLVYNYKDDSLSNSETKTYGDFGRENMTVIAELYGKDDNLVHFRNINKEEMQKFLNDIKQFSGAIDLNGVEENNKNIKNKEEKDNILKKESEEKNKANDLRMVPFVELYNFLKQDIGPLIINRNEGEYNHFVKGEYSYDYDESGYLKISFIDSDGYKNLIKADLSKGNFKVDQSIKMKKNEDGTSDRKNISEDQISKIISNVLLDIKKK